MDRIHRAQDEVLDEVLDEVVLSRPLDFSRLPRHLGSPSASR